MAALNDLLNQLVGLCAGRGGLLRLERRQLLEEFKRLPENYEDKVEFLSDCQICMDFISASADAGADVDRRSFLKPWEQPNHGITFRRRQKPSDLPKSIRHDGSIKILDPFAFLHTLPITPMSIPTQQIKLHQNFTIPQTWSGEHKASFPPTVLPVPLVLPRQSPCKVGQGYQEADKRLGDGNGLGALKPSQGANRLPSAVTDSHRFHIKATMDHIDTGFNFRRSDTESVYLDRFEAEMRNLTIKLIKESCFRHETVLGGPGNPYRVRVVVDAVGASPEEIEQAKQSTTIRGHYGLPYQLRDPGRVNVYKNAHAMETRGYFRGWVGR
jgi:hypothetical protein